MKHRMRIPVHWIKVLCLSFVLKFVSGKKCIPCELGKFSNDSSCDSFTFFSVKGGDVIRELDGYRYHLFTSTGRHILEVESSGTVDLLVVGGGGGGGGRSGSGGGAGGVIFRPGVQISSGQFEVNVGDGGIGGLRRMTNFESDFSTNGEDSSALGFVAFGGGRGRGDWVNPGIAGGSGGGGRYGGEGGKGTPGQGHDGGNSVGDGRWNNGGGGGAGSRGGDGTYYLVGDGGDGIYIEMFAPVAGVPAGWFGGGGGGGSHGPTAPDQQGTGGKGGGGDGGDPSLSIDRGKDGHPNTGGGGGGAIVSGGNGEIGGKGGSGIIIIRYPSTVFLDGCDPCPPMTYRSEISSNECKSCTEGRFSLSGWTSCLPTSEEAYKNGCADGEREWFTDSTVHPLIAGCSGAFHKSGLKKRATEINHDVTCNNFGGDDGPYPNGEICSASDLCAPGWHLCSDAVEVESLSGTGDCDVESHINVEDVFFATGQSTNGARLCVNDGVDNIVGCGLEMEVDNASFLFGSSVSSQLLVWLAADSFSDPATNNLWKDKSGNGYDFLLSDLTAYKIDPDDGEAYLDLKGGNGWLYRSESIPAPISKVFSIFVVTRLRSLSSQYRTLLWESSSGQHLVSTNMGKSDLGIIVKGIFQSCGFSILPEFLSSWSVLEFRVSESSPYFTFEYNGGIPGCSVGVVQDLQLSGFDTIGSARLAGHSWGDIREILIFRNSLEYFESKRVSKFLIRKWNLQKNSRLGFQNNAKCGVLNKELSNVASLTNSWRSSLERLEAISFQKLSSGFGGVLCCRNVTCSNCENEGKVCLPKLSGCSDGSREWFQDELLYPHIAGCAGGFSQPGLKDRNGNPKFPACERNAGNHAPNPSGEGCSAADLCESGWKICDSPLSILSASRGRFCDNSNQRELLDGSFFASASTLSTLQNSCSSKVPSSNTIAGCGNLHSNTFCEIYGASVFSDAVSCDSLPSSWNCSVLDSTDPVFDITNAFSDNNGVLCCRESMSTCENCGGSFDFDCSLSNLNSPKILSIFPSNCSSEGNLTLTIMGRNFGSEGSIYIGDRICSTRAERGFYSNLRIECTIPSLPGGNLIVSVVSSQGIRSDDNVLLSVNPPKISKLFTQNNQFPTIGGIILTIKGSSFGDSIAQIFVKGQSCPEIVEMHSHSVIGCLLPSGQGTSTEVYVVVGGKQSQTSVFDYDPPRITSIFNQRGSTFGGENITFLGSNFGKFGSVFINDIPCHSSGFEWEHSVATCTLPPGEGQNLIVVFSLDDRNTTSEIAYSYAAPEITFLYPSRISSTNLSSLTLTLKGNNFGKRPRIFFGNHDLTLFLKRVDDISLEIDLPHYLSGTENIITIMAGNQNSSCSFMNCFVSVEAPIISSVSGCNSTLEGINTVECPISGAKLITISGYNFGTNPVALIQNRICTFHYHEINNETGLHHYVCNLPSNPGGKLNASVEISVDGLSGSAKLISYSSPMYVQGSLRILNANVAGNRLNSSGGTQISFLVEDLPQGIHESEMKITYGPVLDSEVDNSDFDSWWLPFNCTDAKFIDLNTISCTTSRGIGKDLSLLIQIRQQHISTLYDTVSYASPVLVDSSLRSGSIARSNSLMSINGLRDLIMFDVGNLDIESISSLREVISVRYGKEQSSGLDYECAVLSITSTMPGISTIHCLTEQGEGDDLVFQLLALNDFSNFSTFKFSYPRSPVVTSVQTSSPLCSNSENSIKDCSTVGGQRITISGDYFCDFRNPNCTVLVFIGIDACSVTEYVSGPKILCDLPPSSGVNVAVIIHQKFGESASFISTPKYLVSFAHPMILSVSGCSDDGQFTKDCSRTELSTITIRGNNFGPRNAAVLINFDHCLDVKHDPVDPHRKLICKAPAGTSSNAVVLVIQDGGLISPRQGMGYLSYKQCTPGTYRNGSEAACPSCELGRFNPFEGSNECISCEPGRYSSIKGSTSCLPCSKGKYTSFESSVCSDCEAGKFSAELGSSVCISCSEGRFNDIPSQSTCKMCQPGSFSENVGSALCEICPLGAISVSLGSISCTYCSAGFFSNVSGGTMCHPCPAAFRSRSLIGSSSCELCDNLSYSSAPGSSTCTVCEPGRKKMFSHATSCTSCEPGTYDDLEGSSICKNCSSGTFSVRQGSKGQCQPCLPGSFAPAQGMDSCILCPPGKFQWKSGQQGCIDCPIGMVSVASGETKCSPCGLGYFSATSGLSTCTPCPAGKISNVQGTSSECISCPKGKYSPSNASYFCNECPVGKYSALDGMTTCDFCSRGKFQSSVGGSSCESCDEGFAASSFGMAYCTSCNSGSFSFMKSSTMCHLCLPGKYQPFSGASNCLNCSLGRVTPDSGSIQCELCGVGRYSNESGSSTCVSCSRGSYQPLVEQQSCLLCPSGKFSFEESGTCMKCGPRSVAPFPGQGTCTACPDNSETDDAQTLCICKAGYYALQRMIVVGNESLPSMTCEECPLGAVCESAGVRWETLETREGWWRPDRNSTNFYQCQLVDHCTGGMTGECGGNREGVLCNRCAEGYEVVGAVCRKCNSASNSIIILVVMVIFIFLVIVGMFHVVLKMDKHQLHQLKNRSELESLGLEFKEDFISFRTIQASRYGDEPSIEGSPTPSPNFVYKLKIMLGFFQICVAMALNLDLPLPGMFKSFISSFNFANFDVVQWTRFGCVVPITFLEKHFMVACFPFALLSGIFLIYLFPKWISYYYHHRRANDAVESAKLRLRFKRGVRKFYKMILFSLFLIYPTVSAIILRLYSCRSIEGISYLNADFRIRCDSKEWKMYAKFNIFFTLVFPVGIPLLFMFLMYTRRHNLHRPEVLVKLGFLYAAYFEDAWWFEIADILHKLALTSLLVFAPLNYRLPVAMVIVLIYLMTFMLVRPYIRKGDDRLHGLVLVELLLLLIGGHVYQNIGKIDRKMDLVLSIVFIGITLCLLLFAILQIFSLTRKMIRMKRHPEDPKIERASFLDLKVQENRADRRLDGVKFVKNPMLPLSEKFTQGSPQLDEEKFDDMLPSKISENDSGASSENSIEFSDNEGFNKAPNEIFVARKISFLSRSNPAIS